MSKLKDFYTSRKKVAIPVTILVVAVIAAGIVGVNVHASNVAKEKAEAQEKKEKAHLEELNTEYKKASSNVENAILDDAERTSLSEELKGYKKKLNGISKKNEKAFDTLRASIKEKYDASAATLDTSVAGLSTNYPTEEGYYSEEFTSSVTALTDELNTLKEAGKYQEAYNKFNEINGTYAAYVEQVNAQKAAEEEAAKQKAEAEAAAKKKAAAPSVSHKTAKDTPDSADSGSSNTTASDTSSKMSADDIVKAEGAAAQAQADAQGYPVQLSDGSITKPSYWTELQFNQWAMENGLY